MRSTFGMPPGRRSLRVLVKLVILVVLMLPLLMLQLLELLLLLLQLLLPKCCCCMHGSRYSLSPEVGRVELLCLMPEDA